MLPSEETFPHKDIAYSCFFLVKFFTWGIFFNEDFFNQKFFSRENHFLVREFGTMRKFFITRKLVPQEETNLFPSFWGGLGKNISNISKNMPTFWEKWLVPTANFFEIDLELMEIKVGIFIGVQKCPFYITFLSWYFISSEIFFLMRKFW